MPLPTDEEIWERVRAFAIDCKANRTPVYTLKNGVRNVIEDVTDDRIHRHSDDGIQDQPQSSVSKRDVIALWHHLLGEIPDPRVLYFTRALMAGALGDLLDVVDGNVQLRARPQQAVTDPKSPKVSQEERAARVWAFLCPQAKAQASASYSEVSAATGIHRQHLGRPLRLIEDACARERIPRLAVLVVNQGNENPGSGFVSESGHSLDTERELVYAFPWDAVPNPFEYALNGETEESLAQKLLLNPEQPLAVYRLVRARGQAQVIFRKVLLDAYGSACAFCGFAVRETLDAAHIHPWSKCEERDRMNPRNGLLLCANHHRMFDAHKIRVTSDYRLSCSREDVEAQMGSFQLGEGLRRPRFASLFPDPRLIDLRYAGGG